MANQKLNAIITIGASMNASVRKTLGGLSGALGRVGDEIGTITKRQRELDKQRKVLERQGQSVEELDREYQQLGQTLDGLRRKQDRLNRISDGLGNVGGAARNAFSTVATQATIAAAAVGAAGLAVFTLVNDTANLGDEVGATAQKIGIGAGALQELQFAAEQSDVTTQQFNESMETFTKNLGLAQRGMGRARPALKALGLDAEKLGQMLPEDALALVADRLQDVETQTERVSIATQLFGGAGADMTLMLAGGSEGLAAMRQEARDLGLVLTDEAIAAAGNFDNEIRRAGMALQGMKNTIGAALIPVVTELAQEFTAFVKNNRPQIEEFARSLGQGFRDAMPVIRDVVSGIGTVAGAIGDVLSFVADLLGGWDNLGIAVGTAFVAPSIIAIGQLGASLVGLIAATGPIGLVIAAVAAAAVLIIANWDTIRDSALAAWGALKDGAQAAIDWVVGKFEYLAATVTALMQPIKDALNWAGDKIDAAGAWLNSGPAEGTTGIVMDPTGVNQFAKGGPMMPGAALVGEQGPELIFPSRSGYVATARQTAQMMGGGGRQVNVGGITINAAPGMDPRAIADAVMARLRAEERSAMYDGVMA